MTRVTVVGAGLLLTLSVAAFAQKVNTDFDAKANFAAFRTYMWTPAVSSKPDKNTAKIEKAIQKMFQQYPPRSK